MPGFFKVVGTPVIEGREFDERNGPTSRPVAVVNRAFADRHFRGGNPLGPVIRVGQTELEIVGIVADSRQVSLKEERPVPMAFGVLTQRSGGPPVTTLRFVMRTSRPDAVRTPIAAALLTLDRRTIEFRTIRDEADASVIRAIGGGYLPLALDLP